MKLAGSSETSAQLYENYTALQPRGLESSGKRKWETHISSRKIRVSAGNWTRIPR